MPENKTLVGYHSTTTENALKILTSNFQMPEADESVDIAEQDRLNKYWLGVGIYFFEDIDVAKWWCTKPSSTFGAVGDHKILQCELDTSCKIWDLRKVSKWREVINCFDYYMEKVSRRFIIMPGESNDEESQNNVVRCMFFDWLRVRYKIDILIAAFNQSEFDYLKSGKYKIQDAMDIYYTEVQYCVYTPSVISKIKLAE